MFVHAIVAVLGLSACVAIPALAEGANQPNFAEGDFTIRDYRFADGETLPELKLHYRTFGAPQRDADGKIVNGVVLLHGTSSTGANWLIPTLADHLYGAGQPLDATKYFIILPDGIGRGGSSKPSDGLRAKFPHYRYHDLVDSEERLVTEGLGVKHLKLVLGVSMGGMHAWMWGEMFPDLMDAIVPIASQPVEISGRNWIMRRIAIEAIKHDPDWHDGNYTTPPTHWIYTAPFSALMTENVVRVQELAPTRAAGDAYYDKRVAHAETTDANNALYGIEAIEDYNPEPDLGRIKAKVLAINSADDMVNPPDLHTVEHGLAHVKDGKYVLIPESAQTHGHFTHLYAAIWGPYVADFLKTVEGAKAAAK